LCVLCSEGYSGHFERLLGCLWGIVKGIKEEEGRWYLEDEGVDGRWWE